LQPVHKGFSYLLIETMAEPVTIHTIRGYFAAFHSSTYACAVVRRYWPIFG
jgi:hypothetical protein